MTLYYLSSFEYQCVFPHLGYMRLFFQLEFVRSPSPVNSLLVKTNSLIFWERAMHSASNAEREISDWSLQLHKIGTLSKMNKTPNLLITLTGSIVSSAAYIPVKLASAHNSMPKLLPSGLITILFLAPFKHLVIRFTSTLWLYVWSYVKISRNDALHMQYMVWYYQLNIESSLLLINNPSPRGMVPAGVYLRLSYSMSMAVKILFINHVWIKVKV